jgi:hypothetical protein
MLNYGDWFGERTYNWGNMEYDTPWCFLHEYLRGGDPDFYTWAEEAVRHLVDVDTCHHHANANRVGEQYAHCVGHVGGYYPDGYREQAIFSGGFSVTHMWVEGLFLYHLLTGEARALESAMKTCDLLVGETLNDYDFSNCRVSGWHLIHLSAAYRATGRRVYLNAARIVVDRVLERQRASGGWERMLVPGHCYCHPPRHWGNADFMVGLLMVGLKRYYEATGDRRVAEAIVRAADFSIRSFWVPEAGSTRYTSCPYIFVRPSPDMGLLKGAALAYHATNEAHYREVLAEGLKRTVEDLPGARRGAGVWIGMVMRNAPQILEGLQGATTRNRRQTSHRGRGG